MRSGKGWCPFAQQVEGVTSYQAGGESRVGFCDHKAAGFYTTLTNPAFWNGAGVSVHFAVSRTGQIAQIVNIFDTAWAQGRLGPTVSWPRYNDMGAHNPNLYLISTEHENAETVNGQTIFYDDWTPDQYAADLKVKRWAVDECAKYGQDALRFGMDSLTGHHEFDSVTRADCPGKHWRDDYHARLYADLTGGDDMGPWKQEGNYWVFYNAGVPVLRVGDDDPRFPGRISKNFGGTWVYLRALDDAGNWRPAAEWHQVPGD